MPEEAALMLKASGPPRSSPVDSLMDWFDLKKEIILVMERPVPSMNLFSFCTEMNGLSESFAKIIVRQLLDAAIDLQSKGVFHRDSKLENILIELDSDVSRLRVIGFGCGVTI
ncbi:hypothetical protein LDENG_00061820 [Lucifuga dentata]|nr:hypothetical protein LDENG_00061820 [Lucifuga dentata]